MNALTCTPVAAIATCPECRGRGRITYDHANDPSARIEDCPDCAGEGTITIEIEDYDDVA